jgi:hypothetical protein
MATVRCTELDDGTPGAKVRAPRPHPNSSTKVAEWAMYILRNRRRMRYPNSHAPGLGTSTRSWKPDAN